MEKGRSTLSLVRLHHQRHIGSSERLILTGSSLMKTGSYDYRKNNECRNTEQAKKKKKKNPRSSWSLFVLSLSSSLLSLSERPLTRAYVEERAKKKATALSDRSACKFLTHRRVLIVRQIDEIILFS